MLDYKYIEQLLERYFECETTLEEEKILRTFFCQNELPESLRQYRDLFAYEQAEPQADRLGADFDAKVMAIINGEQTQKPAKRITLRSAFSSIHSALHPFFKAAAIVAVIITVGNASQALFTDDSETTSVAKIQTTTGKNVADVQTASDTLAHDTLQVLH